MDEQKQILKLAAEIANNDLRELVEGYRRRLLIVDSQIEAFRNLERDYRKTLSEMNETINNLVAVCRVCSRLNILCVSNDKSLSKVTKAEEPQKGKRNRDNGGIKVNISKPS